MDRWGITPVRRLEVTGRSMQPTLLPGDRLLAVRTRRLRPGDLVVVPDPRAPDRLLVKRLRGVQGGQAVVAGDNTEASTDSRLFGPVPTASLWGRAVYRYWPPERVGVIAGRRRPWPARWRS